MLLLLLLLPPLSQTSHTQTQSNTHRCTLESHKALLTFALLFRKQCWDWELLQYYPATVRIRCMCALVGHTLTPLKSIALLQVMNAWESRRGWDEMGCICLEWRSERRVRGWCLLLQSNVTAGSFVYRRFRWRDAASWYLMARRRSWRLNQSVYCYSARSKRRVIWERTGRTASRSAAAAALRTCVFFFQSEEKSLVSKNSTIKQYLQSLFFSKARSQRTRAMVTKIGTIHRLWCHGTFVWRKNYLQLEFYFRSSGLCFYQRWWLTKSNRWKETASLKIGLIGRETQLDNHIKKQAVSSGTRFFKVKLWV